MARVEHGLNPSALCSASWIVLEPIYTPAEKSCQKAAKYFRLARPWRVSGRNPVLRLVVALFDEKIAVTEGWTMLKVQRRNGQVFSGERSLTINFEGIRHAPENELGVVFLFSKIAKRFGFIEIDVIQPQFPDCWAYRRTSSGVKRVWIEFEFRSHSFKSHLGQLHGLNPRKGVVICWDNDWPECERYAEVIELRSELGYGREIWVQNTLPEFQAGIDDTPKRVDKSWTWTVSKRARPGDLVLMYRAGSKAGARKYGSDEDLLQSIANVFKVKSFPKKDTRWGFEAVVTQVAILTNPLRLEHMRVDRVLKNSPFIRRSMLGRSNVTPYWYRIYDLILRLNSDRQTRLALAPFAPEML